MNTEQSHLDWIAKRKAVEDRRKARAAANLMGHRYRMLANTNGVEVWRCAAPGSSFYAFDIVMTRFGIAIVGDIENMTFTVGNYYGMKFLAGDDVEYYLHTKLDQKCKEVEFDEDAWREQVVRGAISRIREISNEEEAGKWPAWVNDIDLQKADIYAELMAFVDAMREAEEDTTWWGELDEALMAAEDIDHTYAAMIFAQENSKELNLDDLEQSTIEKTRESVYANLYMINHAAKAIMAMKALATNVGGKADE